MTEPIVVLAWLVVAHLVADFVVQTSRIAIDKQDVGRRARRALVDHAIGVAVCLVPLVVAFGLPGLAFLVLTFVTHPLIDRAKVVLNRRAETVALADALARHGTLVGSGGLGTAWTPVPAALFVVDQLVHVLVAVVLWAVLLRETALTGAWSGAVDALVGGVPPAEVRAVGLGAAVVAALAIVNVRAASLLIGTLVSPREVLLGQPPLEPRAEDSRDDDAHDRPGSRPAAATQDDAVQDDAVPAGVASAEVAPAETFVRMRIGPLEIRSAVTSGTRETHAATAAAARAPGHAAGRIHPTPISAPDAGPARIGEAIGVLERLLVIVFVLTGSLAAIGFVVAAKTLARFKQLDDRAFAEYYLLGTLASVSIALLSAIAAAAALGIPLKG